MKIKNTTQQRYAIVCRVSTKKQFDTEKEQSGKSKIIVSKYHEDARDSLDIQERLARRMIEEEYNGIVHCVIHTQRSGRYYYSNEALQEAIGLVEKGEVDGIVFYDFDSFCRNDYWPFALSRIRRARGKLLFVCLKFTDGPEGEMQMGHSAVNAKYFAQKQRITAIRYLREYAHDGVQMARSDPFGYYIVKNIDVIRGYKKPAGTYEIRDQEKANYAHRIFEMRSKGKTLQQICDYLDNHIAPPASAKLWQTGTVWQIIHNTVYKGLAHYGKFQLELDEERTREGKSALYKIRQPEEAVIYIPVPRIVTPRLWGKCQNINPRRKS